MLEGYKHIKESIEYITKGLQSKQSINTKSIIS